MRTMSKVLLGEIAIERKETCKGNKDGFPIVGLEHLIPEQVTLSDWDEDKINTFTKLFSEGDVLFGRRRAYLKKAAVAPFDGICSGDITVIKAIPERILPELLPFIIQNDSFFQYAVGKSAGSLSPRVKWEHLRNYEFELPNIEKQRELARILWAMEETKKSYQKLLQLSNELVKSQFIDLFSLPGINKYGFTECKIKNVIIDLRYGTSKPASEHGTYPYLRMNNITYDGKLDLSELKYIDLSESELDKCMVRQGDVLFNRTNSRELVGKTCVFTEEKSMVIAGYIIRVRLNERVLPLYLSVMFNTDYGKALLKKMAKGAIGQANINAQALQNIDILLPPLLLQEQFAAFVRQSDKTKFELEKTLVELTGTYKKLMSANFG